MFNSIAHKGGTFAGGISDKRWKEDTLSFASDSVDCSSLSWILTAQIMHKSRLRCHSPVVLGSVFFLTAPTYPMNLTQHDNFEFVCPQLGAADDFLINSLLFELPTAPLANSTNSRPINSPLNRLNIISPTSPLSPLPSDLPSEQSAHDLRRRTAGSERSTQESMPKKATSGRSYAYKALDFIPAS